MADTPEALAEKWAKLTREDFYALLARLAEAEKALAYALDAQTEREMAAEADRDRYKGLWELELKRATDAEAEAFASRLSAAATEQPPRPDYDPRIDHPERYTDGPI